MPTSTFAEKTLLGRTGLAVSRIGLAGGYGVPTRAVERAFHESGVNYFYWETRKPGMRAALKKLIPFHRKDMVLAVQSYDHIGLWLRRSVEKALKQLGTDYADVLLLGWFNRKPGRRLLDMAQGLVEEGKVRHLGVTGHNRGFHSEMARVEGGPFDVLQIRYSAAHRGAETEVFEGLSPASPTHAPQRPGITIYTATRWGRLLNPKKMPPGEEPMTAAECYRFVLSHPVVDLCIAGPRTEEEMDQGLEALTAGPLAPKEIERVRRIGDHVHG